MRIKYYETAWRDISNTPGWFGKLCLLALVNFIPVFGQIVTFGYLYGWAREIAWGVHAPMPAKLFNNDDGKFWRRGWFVLVITLAFALVPAIVMSIGQAMQGLGFEVAANSQANANAAMMGLGSFVYLVGAVFAFLMSMLAWIGSMRTSIYDRLSAGFQLGKIWKMFRRDTGGIFRILGMELLISLIVGIILSFIIGILLFFVMFAGVAGLAAAGYTMGAVDHMSTAQATQMLLSFMAAAGPVGILCLIICMFACGLATSFVYALVFRAVGYWTAQFDVPHWRGQNDPMPFEADPQMAQPLQQVQTPYDYSGGQGQAGYPGQEQGQPPMGYQQQPQAYYQPEAQSQVQPQATQPVVGFGQVTQPAVDPAQAAQPAVDPAQAATPVVEPIQAVEPQSPAQPHAAEAQAAQSITETVPIAQDAPATGSSDSQTGGDNGTL